MDFLFHQRRKMSLAPQLPRKQTDRGFIGASGKAVLRLDRNRFQLRCFREDKSDILLVLPGGKGTGWNTEESPPGFNMETAQESSRLWIGT